MKLSYLAIASLLFVTACQDTPAFRLRWTVDTSERQDLEPSSGPPGLFTAADCSRVGLTMVEVLTFSGTGDELSGPVDRRYSACFPFWFAVSTEGIDGPTLDDGQYTVFVRGVQTNRSRSAWFDESIGADGPNWCSTINPGSCAADEAVLPPVCNDDACPAGYVACDCTTVSVDGGDPTFLPNFTLGAPPECEDGIDNDGDHLIDRRDPGCEVYGHENAEVDVSKTTIVDVGLSIFGVDVQDTLQCEAIDLSRFELKPSWLDTTIDLVCGGDPVIRIPTPPDDATPTLTLTGVTGSTSVTADITVPLEITEGLATPQFALGPEQFIEPVEAAIFLVIECDTGETVRVQSYMGDQPTPIALADESGSFNGEPLSCPTEGYFTTEPVVWGTYSATVSVGPDDATSCWATLTPQALFPGLWTIDLEATGESGCPECRTNLDCDADQICSDDVCEAI